MLTNNALTKMFSRVKLSSMNLNSKKYIYIRMQYKMKAKFQVGDKNTINKWQHYKYKRNPQIIS